MKIGDLLNTLAGKIGQQNNQALIDVLSRADLQSVEIPDALASQLSADLMSLDGAKNNSAVRNHFFAQALNGIDTELANTVTSLGIEDDIFGTEKNTNGKMRLLATKIKDLLEQKEGATGKEKTELQKQINELNQKLAQSIDAHKAEIGTLTKQYESQMLDHRVLSCLQGRNYANKDVPAEVNAKFAKTLLSEALEAKGVKLVNENGALKLKQAANVELDFYDENHKAVSFEDFAAKVLADNKLLAVTDPNRVNNPPTPPVITPDGGQQQNTAGFNAAIQAALGDLKTE